MGTHPRAGVGRGCRGPRWWARAARSAKEVESRTPQAKLEGQPKVGKIGSKEPRGGATPSGRKRPSRVGEDAEEIADGEAAGATRAATLRRKNEGLAEERARGEYDEGAG